MSSSSSASASGAVAIKLKKKQKWNLEIIYISVNIYVRSFEVMLLYTGGTLQYVQIFIIQCIVLFSTYCKKVLSLAEHNKSS